MPSARSTGFAIASVTSCAHAPATAADSAVRVDAAPAREGARVGSCAGQAKGKKGGNGEVGGLRGAEHCRPKL
eukprot:235170-Chlamydomonas_euryale.AAC.1